MKYKGTKLLLDNFREVLKGFSIDIQDVVRSAILDDVDVSNYIDICNPYKLDQIRLCLKEGIDTTYFTFSGEMLYSIRKMYAQDADISPLKIYQGTSLSEEHYQYLLNWVKDSVDTQGINLTTISKKLLPMYDKGFRQGIQMAKYSSIRDEEYLASCFQIEKRGIDVTELAKSASNNNRFCMSRILRMMKNTNLTVKQMNHLAKLSAGCSYDRFDSMCSMVLNNIPVEPWLERKKQKVDGVVHSEFVIEDSVLNVALRAYKDGLNPEEFLKVTNKEDAESLYNKLKLAKEAKVSGRFIKKQKKE